MSKPVLFIMYGTYGSGKSTFGRQLASELPATWLRSDRIRAELQAERQTPLSEQDEELVFGGMDATALQELSRGKHVIYDGNRNVPDTRQRTRTATADKLGIPAVTVWMNTPIDECIRRAAHRHHDEHAVIIGGAEVKADAERLLNPTPDELCIAIDGTAHFATQYRQFTAQFNDILGHAGPYPES